MNSNGREGKLGVVKINLPKAELNAPRENKRVGEQVIGREAETATLLSRCPFTLCLRVAVSAHVNAAVRCLVLIREILNMRVKQLLINRAKNMNPFCKIVTVIYVVLLCGTNLFAQAETQKNWFQLDPTADSIAGISLEKAYELLKGRASKTIIVAVIDNGVDIEHEDLKNVVWTNTKEIAGNGIDDDHNGYIDDIHGWNFRGAKDGTTVENEQLEATRIYSMWKNKYDNADVKRLSRSEKKEFDIYTKAKKEYLEKLKEITNPTDLKFAYNLNYNSSELIGDNPANPNERNYGSPFMKLTPNLSHGTHVAGIIAAQRNNQKGVDGIADNVLIMPILATTATGDERDKDVANAIRYAVNNGAKVINMSFSKRFSPDKKVVDEAIRYAEKRNVLIIHAAGNDGEDIDIADNYHYPIAIYENGKRATNFITVGWNRSKFDYRLAHPYSDYGAKNVDIFAPGSDILSTVPGNSYDFKSASSMSTPMVSGVAALLLSYFPTLTTAQVEDIILKSSFKPETTVNRPGTKIELPFRSLSVSGGIVNAYNAVKLAISTTERK